MTRRSAADAATNADQLESEAILTGPIPVGDALTDDLVAEDDINERFGFQADSELEHWAQVDTVNDSVSADIQEEIERRRNLLGESYPFEFVGNALS
jgi:hypothetical protein